MHPAARKRVCCCADCVCTLDVADFAPDASCVNCPPNSHTQHFLNVQWYPSQLKCVDELAGSPFSTQPNGSDVQLFDLDSQLNSGDGLYYVETTGLPTVNFRFPVTSSDAMASAITSYVLDQSLKGSDIVPFTRFAQREGQDTPCATGHLPKTQRLSSLVFKRIGSSNSSVAVSVSSSAAELPAYFDRGLCFAPLVPGSFISGIVSQKTEAFTISPASFRVDGIVNYVGGFYLGRVSDGAGGFKYRVAVISAKVWECRNRLVQQISPKVCGLDPFCVNGSDLSAALLYSGGSVCLAPFTFKYKICRAWLVLASAIAKTTRTDVTSWTRIGGGGGTWEYRADVTISVPAGTQVDAVRGADGDATGIYVVPGSVAFPIYNFCGPGSVSEIVVRFTVFTIVDAPPPSGFHVMSGQVNLTPYDPENPTTPADAYQIIECYPCEGEAEGTQIPQVDCTDCEECDDCPSTLGEVVGEFDCQGFASGESITITFEKVSGQCKWVATSGGLDAGETSITYDADLGQFVAVIRYLGEVFNMQGSGGTIIGNYQDAGDNPQQYVPCGLTVS